MRDQEQKLWIYYIFRTGMSFFHRNQRGLWLLIGGLLLAAFFWGLRVGFPGSAHQSIPEQVADFKDKDPRQLKHPASRSSAGGQSRKENISYPDILRNFPTKTEIENWLEKRGRSSRNLLAAAALGGAEDKRLILESLKNNPNDPATLMRVLQFDLLPERREELYETLRRNAPDNSMPCLLEACRLLEAGKSESGLKALLSAAQRPGFETYIKDIQNDAELMLRDMGRDELGAAAMATLGIRNPVLEEISFRLSVEDVKDPSPLLMAAQISALEAICANPTTVMDKYASIASLNDLIDRSKNYAEELGPYLDRPFNDYNESISEQREEASKYVKYLSDPGKILAGFPVETQIDFFRRASKLGEMEALDWLLSEGSAK